MNKKQRQQVFDKYGGRCAYCGCELVKGWHVDHAKPIIRITKRVGGYYVNPITGARLTAEDFSVNWGIRDEATWVPSRSVADGCQYPELDCMDNWMPACQSCNINKHQMDVEQFREQIARFVVSLNKASTQYKMAKRYGLVTEVEKPIVFYFELPLKQQKQPINTHFEISEISPNFDIIKKIPLTR